MAADTRPLDILTAAWRRANARGYTAVHLTPDEYVAVRDALERPTMAAQEERDAIAAAIDGAPFLSDWRARPELVAWIRSGHYAQGRTP